MTPEEHEAIMRQWDSWRTHIASGGEASWPRDEFEALIERFSEEINTANARALAAEAERDALKAQIVKSQKLYAMADETSIQCVFMTEDDAIAYAIELNTDVGPWHGVIVVRAVETNEESSSE